MSIVAAPQKEKTYARLLERIKYMAPGTPLPSVRELMVEFSVGQATLVSAYDDLEDRGLVERKPRKGVFVADKKHLPINEFVSEQRADGVCRNVDNLVAQDGIDFSSYSGNSAKAPLKLTNVALVLPAFFLDGAGRHPMVSIILSGLNRALNHQKYAISTMFYRPGCLWEDCGKLAMERDVRGLLLWPDSTVTIDDMRQLLGVGIEIVFTQNANRFAELGLISVNVDIGMALAQTLEKFYQLGHRNIVTTMYVNNPMRRRHMDIIEEFCAKTNLSVSKMIFDISNEPGVLPDYSVLSEVLDREERPTAIVLFDESVASTIFRLCYERNIRIPEQVSLAALIDNTPHVHPVPLTAPDSLSLGIEEARLGAEYLEKLLLGEVPSVRDIHLRCNMEWKASVGPVPTIGK